MTEQKQTTVWVCGRYLALTDQGSVWELQGIFLSEQEAVAACRDESYFVGPEILGLSLPHETTQWQGSYYPLIPQEVAE